MKRLCDFDYCIYNKDKECVLSSISISETGYCNECIVPSINKDTLEKYKQFTRAKLEFED